MDTSVITQGLNVDAKVVQAAFEGVYDAKRVEAVALKLASDLTDYDNMCAGGRMLLYNATRVCGDTSSYVGMMEHRLNKPTAAFLTQHAAALDAELASRVFYDYQNHDLFSASTLIKTYLMKPTWGEMPWETPQQMHLRVATQLYADQGLDRVLQCYRELSSGYYTPASPTLFNAGTKTAQMSSCFLLTVGDNLKDILYMGVGDAGMISKDNGGLGINLNNLRHSMIGDVGMSSGILPAARVYDKAVKYVDQGGKRDGACTTFLRSHHIDIKEFVLATDNFTDHQLRFGTLNTCIWESDLFFERVEVKGKWTVFCPAKATELNQLYGPAFEEEYVKMERLAVQREAEFETASKAADELKGQIFADPKNPTLRTAYQQALQKKVAARKARIEHKVYDASELYDIVCQTQIRSGMPYIMFGDPANFKSNQKNMGPIDSSNLCLEVIERSSPNEIASCNLSSLNMAAFATGIVTAKVGDADFRKQLRAAYDFKLYGQMTQSVVENLEQVIIKNDYPLDEKESSGGIKRGKISSLNLRTRPLGIGVSGFSDAAYMMDLGFDDPRTEYWNKVVFACSYFNGMVASVKLALKHGAYEEFKTGSYQRYVGFETTPRREHIAGKRVPIFETVSGSPLSNGQFQFDLWAEEARMLADLGKLDEKVYDRADDKPVSPSEWGQETITITHEGKTVVIEPTWESLRQAVVTYGVRHSLIFALMPTASTAQALRNTESTEAPQANLYSRRVISGNYIVANRHLVKDMKALGCWDRGMVQFLSACKGSVKWVLEYIQDHPQRYASCFEGGVMKPAVAERLKWLINKYKTMFEVSQKVNIKYAAQRGRYVCQSQSLNIYVKDPTVTVMRAIHSFARKHRVKTGMYYLRQDPAKYCGDFNIDAEMLEYYVGLEARMKPATAVAAPPVKVEPVKPVEPVMVCRKEKNCISCS